MKNYYFFLFLLLFQQRIYSQNYVPLATNDTITWCGATNEIYQGTQFQLFTTGQDTILGNIHYYPVYIVSKTYDDLGNVYTDSLHIIQYIREDNKKWYLYSQPNVLLFDYNNISVGDTLNNPMGEGRNVVSIDSIFLLGNWRKRYNLSASYGTPMSFFAAFSIIEGIGSTKGPFRINNFFPSNQTLNGYTEGSTNCLPFFNPLSLTKSQHPYFEWINKDNVHFELNLLKSEGNIRLELFDFTGKSCFLQSINEMSTDLYLPFLAKGLYIISIVNNQNEFAFQKFIVP